MDQQCLDLCIRKPQEYAKHHCRFILLLHSSASIHNWPLFWMQQWSGPRMTALTVCSCLLPLSQDCKGWPWGLETIGLQFLFFWF